MIICIVPAALAVCALRSALLLYILHNYHSDIAEDAENGLHIPDICTKSRKHGSLLSLATEAASLVVLLLISTASDRMEGSPKTSIFTQRTTPLY